MLDRIKFGIYITLKAAILLWALWGMCVSVAHGQTKAADPSPTLKETSEWVATKIIAEGGFTITIDSRVVSDVYKDVSIENGHLRFTSVNSDNGTPGYFPPSRMIQTFDVPLDKVTYIEVYEIKSASITSGQGVRIITAGKDISSRLTQEKNGKTISENAEWPAQNSVTVALTHAPEPDIAPRMQKALNHAVELCKQSPPKEAF